MVRLDFDCDSSSSSKHSSLLGKEEEEEEADWDKREWCEPSSFKTESYEILEIVVKL